MTEEKYLTLFDDKTFEPPANYFDDYEGMGTAAKEQEMQIDAEIAQQNLELKAQEAKVEMQIKAQELEIKKAELALKQQELILEKEQERAVKIGN